MLIAQGLDALSNDKIGAIGKFDLLRYLSEFRVQVVTAITSDLA